MDMNRGILQRVWKTIFLESCEISGAPNESVPHIICSPEESCWLAEIQVCR